MIIKINKILCFTTFLSLFFINLSSQQLSENYLESVPDYLQGELLDEVDKENNKKTLEAPEITLNKTRKMLSEMKKELENINARFTETYLNPDIRKGELTRFGDDFFNTLITSYSPLNDPNPSNTYILDVGDILGINIIGNNFSNSSVEISRDGSITIPKIGSTKIAGLELSLAVNHIEKFVNERSLGSQVYVSIENIKDIQVLVIGGIESKGVYTLTGNTNILHIINKANGIAENGSYRDISVLRNGNIVKEYDLYEIFISGKITNDFQFISGDTVKVGFIKHEVSISGGINNPAIYEYKAGNSIKDIIDMAGGLLPYANKNSIGLERSNNDDYSSLIIGYEEFAEVLVEPMDNIFVYSFKPKPKSAYTVNISGSVNKPGTYDLSEGSKLSELIAQAGGYKNDAYSFGAQLYRKDLIKKEEAIRQKLLDSLLNNEFNRLTSPVDAQFFYEKLKNNKPVGRLNVEFDQDSLRMDPSKDTLLKNGDEIIVPSFPNYISVYGEVNVPGSFIYKNELDIMGYIDNAGGTNYFADIERIVLLSPNGKSYLVNNSFFGKLKKGDIILYPGSMIYVPRKFVYIDRTTYISRIAPIFSSLALSIASLNSLNN